MNMNLIKFSSLVLRPVIFKLSMRSLSTSHASFSGKPKVAAKEPYVSSIISGKRYSWCACGLSKKQPFCDGSHKGSGLGPHRMKATETTDVVFCGCKQTATPPFCDGSHMTEKVQNCSVGDTL